MTAKPQICHNYLNIFLLTHVKVGSAGLKEKTMTQERRKSDRFDTLNLSYVQVDEKGAVIHEGMGRTLNVSKDGILLEIACDEKLAGHVVLQIALDDELVDLKGNIVHCEQNEAQKYQTGIEFCEVDDKARVILGKFIQVFEQ